MLTYMYYQIIELPVLRVFHQNCNVSCNPNCSFKTAEAQNTGVLHDPIAYRQFSLALAHETIIY